MFEAMKEKVKIDNAYEYKLIKPYHEYSQVELVKEIWSHKGPEDLKVMVEHEGKKYELYTIDCNSAQEFLNKYYSFFQKTGISFDSVPQVEKVVNEDEAEVTQDEVKADSNEPINNEVSNTEQEVNISTTDTPIETTSNEHDDKFVDITVPDATHKIYNYFNFMLKKKRELGKDVRLNINGTEINTENCNTYEDMSMKYIFEEYQQYYDHCLKKENIREAIYLFKIPRGNRYDGSEVNKEAMLSEISRKTREYQDLFNKKDQLDFNNPAEVFNWIVSLAPYINNHALTLPVGLSNIEYQSQDKLLLAVLKEKGYTSQNVTINNKDDLYRQQIAFQLKQLEDYHFFVTEYEDLSREDLKLTTEVVKNEAKLLMYQDRLQYCQDKLIELEEYELGNINTKGGNFDKQIKILTKEIEKLEWDKKDVDGINAVSNKLTTATALITNTMSDGELDDISMKAGKVFLNAESVPTPSNIQEAVDIVLTLPDSSFKTNLIDGITNLARRYLMIMDEEDMKDINEKLAVVGISLAGTPNVGPDSEIDNKITMKESEINRLRAVKEKRIIAGKPIREKIKYEIMQLEVRIEDLNNKLGKNVKKEIESTQEEKPFWENSKLSELAKEGNIFTDTSRVDQSHSWLSTNNAKNLGYLSDNPVEETAEIENSNLEDDNLEIASEEDEIEIARDTEPENTAMIPEDYDNDEEYNYSLSDVVEDSLFNFTPIQTVKRISKTLHDKVSQIGFKEKVKKAVEKLKEKVKPVIQGALDKYAKPIIITTGLALGAVAAIAMSGPSSNNTYQEPEQKEETIENNQEMDAMEEDIQNLIQESHGVSISFTNQAAETESKPSFEEASKNAISGTLTGENTVYTNAYDAFQGVNGVETDRLINSSWENATADTYYTVDNGELKMLTSEEAEEKYNSGESVIAKAENNGVGIGFVEVENQQEQSSGMTL